MDGTGSPPGPDGPWQAPAAAGACRGVLTLPGSKSITNRALVLAALSQGPTLITGALQARDTALMTAALRGLGAAIEPAGQDGASGVALRVTPGAPLVPSVAVDVGNAGTVLRFVPAVAALTGAQVRFTGDARAAQRPARPLLDGLRAVGASIDDGGRGSVPFTVHGSGSLPGGPVTLDASASSQFISGLLLAAARFDKGIEIRHEGPPVPSAPHLAMTVAMLQAAGADVTAHSRAGTGPDRGWVPDLWRVEPGPLAPHRIAVEPDLSAAAPFLAAAVLTGGSVTIAGWPADSLQPAGQILAVLTAMGARCAPGPDGMTVTGTGQIRGARADLRDVSELSPVLTALAALASSPSQFTGIGHQRHQECDRLAVLAAQIGALGGEVTELPDGLAITPRPLRAGPAPFDTHDDHRMVMAAAVLGLAVPGLRIAGAATVGKTFPGFRHEWEQLAGGPP